jgi:glycosyltransferase involved in cell wall biosynthesis
MCCVPTNRQMRVASVPFFQTAKSVYYGLFNGIATASLRRPNSKSPLGELAQSAIKIVSYYGRHNGISEGAILQHAAFRALGYDVQTIDVTRAMRNPFIRLDGGDGDLFIFHCGGDHFLPAAWPLRGTLPRGKVVAYLAWELPDPPSNWPQSYSLWDQIWTPSHYSARSLSQWSDCPIRVVPHVLLQHDTEPRQWRKGKEILTFLTIADARSSISRKNPRGAVFAFRRAFPDKSDVRLIVKLHKTSGRASVELDQLLAEIREDPRIQLINQTLSREEMNQLYRGAHVLVSLHRAEGFGIPLLEAQTFGLATIATAWSGNMDFMAQDRSLLVPYALTSTYDAGGTYGKVTWADPDIDRAAAAMRSLYDDQTKYEKIAAAGWVFSRPEKQLDRFAAALKSVQMATTGLEV